MFNQILLTALVLAIVLVITRMRRSATRDSQRRPTRASTDTVAARRWLPSGPAIVGYSLVLVMIVGATSVFYLQWVEANRIVTLEVSDSRFGTTTTYQVYKKDLGEREFRTVDDRRVSLGDGDRVELVEE